MIQPYDFSFKAEDHLHWLLNATQSCVALTEQTVLVGILVWFDLSKAICKLLYLM